MNELEAARTAFSADYADARRRFLAAAAALFVAAQTRNRALLLPALVFLGGHALLHLVEMITHGTTATAALRDMALIVVPAFLPLAAFRGRALS